VSAAHRSGSASFHVFRRDILDVGGHEPLVPKRVDKLAGPVAVELVLDLALDGCASGDRPVEDRIDVL